MRGSLASLSQGEPEAPAIPPRAGAHRCRRRRRRSTTAALPASANGGGEPKAVRLQRKTLHFGGLRRRRARARCRFSLVLDHRAGEGTITRSPKTFHVKHSLTAQISRVRPQGLLEGRVPWTGREGPRDGRQGRRQPGASSKLSGCRKKNRSQGAAFLQLSDSSAAIRAMPRKRYRTLM